MPLTAAEILALTRERMTEVETLRLVMSGRFEAEDLAVPFELDGAMELPDRAHGTFDILGETTEFLRLGEENYIGYPGYGFEPDYYDESGGAILGLLRPLVDPRAAELFSELERLPDETLEEGEFYHITFRMDMLWFIEEFGDEILTGMEIRGRGDLFIDPETFLPHRFSLDCNSCLLPLGQDMDLLLDFTLYDFNETVHIPTPDEAATPAVTGGRQDEARLAEFQDISVAAIALMVENNQSSIPNPVSANTSPCTTGTQDMTAFPDTTSDTANSSKVNDPTGTAYDFDGIAPDDAKGYILFGHDITADSEPTPTVNYVNFDTTTYCYRIDSDGTVYQFLTDGTLIDPSAPPVDTSSGRAELSTAQIAFDTLLGEGVVGSVTANSGARTPAVYAWTGLPVKADGLPIMVGGVAADLTDYMRLSGAAGDETTYAYCWDSTGLLQQKQRGETCGDGVEAPALAPAAPAAAEEPSVLAVPTAAEPAGSLIGPEGQNYGGTLRIGVVDFGTMDPVLMGLSEGSSIYSELTYDNGAVLWYDGTLTPWAIESWSTNDNVSQYTFNVRQGIMFHSGNELTAGDIKFTFDRILDPATASPLRGQIDYITNITVLDDYHVRFDLETSNAFLPAHLSLYHGRIVPANITSDEITTGEYGSGAFILGEHNPVERTVLGRNPNYWRTGYPFVDEVVLYYLQEMTSRLAALNSGAIDAVFEPSFAALDALAENPNVIVKQTPSAGVRVLDFHTDRRPFNNLDLRKAFQYAVDRTFVREAALRGYGANANDHPVGINDEYYWDEQPITDQDIPRAMAYLDAAGYPDGIDVVLHTSDFGQKLEMALAFRDSVAAAGIRVEVSNDDPTTYWEEYWMNECCPFVASSWGPRPANEALSVQLRSGGVWNESYYNNPRLDELLDLANAEPDLATRTEYFREVQEILIEDVPVLYLMYVPVIVAHRDRVQGVRAHPGLAHTFIEDWWIDE